MPQSVQSQPPPLKQSCQGTSESLVEEFGEAGAGVAGKNVSISQGRATIRCRSRIWSRRTVDACCSSALLRAAATLSKSYLGTVCPSTTVLSSALQRCSSSHYAMALQVVTAALYYNFRWRSPLRCASSFCPLPRSHLRYPSLSASLPWCSPPHFPGAHLSTLPTITSALRRDSPLRYTVALFPISSWLSFALRRPPDP